MRASVSALVVCVCVRVLVSVFAPVSLFVCVRVLVSLRLSACIFVCVCMCVSVPGVSGAPSNSGGVSASCYEAPEASARRTR